MTLFSDGLAWRSDGQQVSPPDPDPRPTGQGEEKEGCFLPALQDPEAAGDTSSRRQKGRIQGGSLYSRNSVTELSGLPTRGPAAGKLGRVGRDLPPPPAPPLLGGHRGVGSRGTYGSSGHQEGLGPPATYQQALHVNGRARVSDQRLQLPLAARARAVPRHGLGGAGHLPRRRGRTCRRQARTRSRAWPGRPRAYRRPRTTGFRPGLRPGPPRAWSSAPRGLGAVGGPPGPGSSAEQTASPPLSQIRAARSTLRRELPQDSEGGAGRRRHSLRPPGLLSCPLGSPGR